MTGFEVCDILGALTDAVLVADGTGQIVAVNPAAERLLGWPDGELVGRPLGDVVPLDAAAARPEALGRLLRGRARRRDGTEAEVELTLSTARADDGAELTVAVLREPELGPRPEVGRYLRATVRAAARLGAGLRPEEVLQAAAESLVADFDAVLARGWLYEPGSATLMLWADAAPAPTSGGESPAPIDPAAYLEKIGEVARSRQPFVRNGLEGEPLIDQGWVTREGIAAAAVFPLVSGDELRGVLALFRRRPLSEEAIEALQALAAIVTVTLGGVRPPVDGSEAEAQRRRLQTVLEVMPVGVLVVEGPEGRLMLANPAAEQIVGGPIAAASIEEFAERFTLSHLDGRSALPDERPLLRALRRGEYVRDRMRYHHPDGAEIILEMATTPLPDRAGAVATFRDITPQVRMETDRAERAAQLKALLDHLPVGVAYLDEQGVCRACNGAANRLLGRHRQELIGAPIEELLGASTELREAVARCLHDREAQDVEAIPWPPSVSNDGEPARYLDWRLVPLAAEPNRPRGALTLILDVTERTRARLALQRAKEAAEQASRNKTQFLSAVSHDLRTPVNALSLQAELLACLVAEQDNPSGELTMLVADLQQAAANLIELLNDLLDLARFDSGQIEHHPSDFALETWLSQTLAPLEVMAHAKGLQFSWRVDQPGRVVRADRIKLGRVLTNLAGNAVKFTERGAVEVTAGAGPDGALVLAVRDTGPGIPADQLERIFDEFAQLRNPERDRTKGTGLGLAICRRLVESVGGRLMVASRPGAGSTFTAILPPDHLPDVALPAPATCDGSTRPDTAPGAAILLVEDDPHSRRSLARLLQHAGFAVEPAPDGPSALEALERGRPALVLLDLMMPGMDGAEVLRRIRAHPSRHDVPVVVLSGDVIGERSRELIALNVNGMIAKPVDFDELLGVVNRYLAASQAAG